MSLTVHDRSDETAVEPFDRRPVATRTGILHAIGGAGILSGLPMPWSVNLFQHAGDSNNVDLSFDSDQPESIGLWVEYLIRNGGVVVKSPGADVRPLRTGGKPSWSYSAEVRHPCGWLYRLYCQVTTDPAGQTGGNR